MAIIRTLDEAISLAKSGARLLTLFSGGVDSSYLLCSLREYTHHPPIALIVDIGGGTERAACDTAKSLGALPVRVTAHNTFVRKYIRPAIHAQATYLGSHPLSASLSRPLFANVACRIARRLNCGAILHTATPSQNSLRRINTCLGDLRYEGQYGSPFENTPASRSLKLHELRNAGLFFSDDSRHSHDDSLWCREREGGPLDNYEDSHARQIPRCSRTDQQIVELAFERGVPVRLDNESVPLIKIIETLNDTGRAFALGYYSGLEELETGVKVLETREMPAASILFSALRALEQSCLPSTAIQDKMTVEQIWVREAIAGRWHRPLLQAAQAFLTSLADSVSGVVRCSLVPHNCYVLSVQASRPLYVQSREAYESTTPAQ